MRHALKSQLTDFISSEIRGRLEIAEITDLSLGGVRARGVRVMDPQGRPVIEAEALTLTPYWVALAFGPSCVRRRTCTRRACSPAPKW